MIQIFSHQDLDGLACALCTHATLEDVHITFMSSAPNRDARMKKQLRATPGVHKVYFLDLGIRQNELSYRGEFPNQSWILIDHHNYAGVIDLGQFDEVVIQSSRDICCADLCKNYFQVDSAHILEWVELAHDRDLWINKKRNITRKISHVIQMKPYLALVKAMELTPEEFLNSTKRLWQKGETAFRRSLHLAERTKQLIETDIGPILICFISGYPSDVAGKLQTGGLIIAMAHLAPSGLMLSLRTDRSDINVEQIARKLGGGGHTYSAACYVPTECFQRLFVDIVTNIASKGEL